ncbi:hypothetical protein I4F81_001664 [Pyropia yezoensis]|uniref:Uncharacterized protein n=1 Tax=Pyropia yezoensis TaxID=2788 RepID=A0ACC3BM84_PYRYE|nr:hypothetical protein I4F81_001664 [Neopyropia yezoensis]
MRTAHNARRWAGAAGPALRPTPPAAVGGTGARGRCRARTCRRPAAVPPTVKFTPPSDRGGTAPPTTRAAAGVRPKTNCGLPTKWCRSRWRRRGVAQAVTKASRGRRRPPPSMGTRPLAMSTTARRCCTCPWDGHPNNESTTPRQVADVCSPPVNGLPPLQLCGTRCHAEVERRNHPAHLPPRAHSAPPPRRKPAAPTCAPRHCTSNRRVRPHPVTTAASAQRVRRHGARPGP